MDWWKKVGMHTWILGWMDALLDGWMENLMDGRMDWWSKNVLMDGQMDERLEMVDGMASYPVLSNS